MNEPTEGDDKRGEADRHSVGSRLKGQRIRDEFLCPITYELFREPVVAWDGHTYEKSAIEKWLLNRDTSPRTGEKMVDNKHLFLEYWLTYIFRKSNTYGIEIFRNLLKISSRRYMTNYAA